MGRITQSIDFITRKVLPAPYERNFIYSHISDEITLKRLRKKLNLSCNELDKDEPELFS